MLKDNKRKRNNQTDTPFKKRSYDWKSKYNNKKKNIMPSMLINKTPTFIPDVYVTKMKLSYAGSLASTTGAIGLVTFKGNSMFDPLGSLGTAQPVGFDQLSALYSRFCVTGSSCKVQVCPRGVVGTDIALIPNVTPPIGSFATIDQMSEQPRSKRAYGFLYDKLILDNYIATSTMYGAPTEKIIIDEDFSGSGTADSPEQFLWVVGYQPSDRATTSTIDYIVDITYYCRWYDRIAKVDA